MGLINVVGIGIPSLLLTLERHENWRSGGFFENVIKVCVPSALTMVITIVMTQICRMSFHWTDDMYSFFAVMLGGLVSLLVVAQVTWPMTRYRKIVFGICCLVFFAAVIFLPDFYDIHSLWTPWSLMLIPLGILISVIISVLSHLTNRLSASFLAARRRRRKADRAKRRLKLK
jgi:cation-transporting ATPase E